MEQIGDLARKEKKEMNSRENLMSAQTSAQRAKQIKKVDKKSLSDQVVQQIKSMITQRELNPGDRLPVEQEMAEYFGVGRHTVREALKKLQVMGVVESKVGKGSFITNIKVKDVMDFMVAQLVMTPGDIENLIEMRRVLEINAAKLAAERATEEGVEKLEDALLKMKMAMDDSKTFVENDMAFHFLLTNLTNNVYYRIVLNAIGNMLYKLQHEVAELTEAKTRALRFHSLIVEAIKDRNPDEAKRWMANHLDDTYLAIMTKKESFNL